MILSGLHCLIGDTLITGAMAAEACWSPADCMAILDAAAEQRVRPDRYIGIGKLRCFDPLALCLADLLEKQAPAVGWSSTNTLLACSVRGAARHYFDVTSVLLNGEPGFSPLAYSNRSLNAVASQVAQVLRLHGGTCLLACPPSQSLAWLRHAWRLLLHQTDARVLLCGGQFPSLHPLTREVYSDLAQACDLAFAFTATVAAEQGQPTWCLQWCPPTLCAPRKALRLCLGPQRDAYLQRGGDVLARSRLGRDPAGLLICAMLLALADEALLVEDASGQVCSVMRLY